MSVYANTKACDLPQREVVDTFFGVFSFLSNFHPCETIYDDVAYPTVEHAYQAAKTLGNRTRVSIRKADTPSKAKRMGRKVRLRPKWEAIKVDIMREILWSKFANPELGDLLVATGDALLLEENSWGDRYWGVVDGDGLNVLGNLLMEIREELK
ncbi:hypothetical protein LCGC14_1855750 [marine sediment metagenome]|uniref:NADAR domain-containing protein n=1 Tax=marine sediment metagenome TaxID=412755 RepID=A0A0F9GXE9_9ZZZZ